MADGSPPTRSLAPNAFGALDYGLYLAVVLLWGTSWIALHLQLGVVAPEVSLVWRFAIAAAIMMGFVALRGDRMRFGWNDHGRFLALGVSIFSLNFLLFYYGGLSTPSGLLAVVFSLASVFNMLLGLLVFRQRPGGRLVLAALMGFLGVVAMFEPQLAGAEVTPAAFAGLLLCVAGTMSFCIGNMLSLAGQRRGVPIASATAWGMVYGTGVLVLISLVRGQAFIVEWTPAYLGSLVWSAVMSSVLAFAAYMTLLSRIGAARAGYSTVLFPVVALAISTLFEGYQWTAPAVLGLVLVIAGNLVMLTGGRR